MGLSRSLVDGDHENSRWCYIDGRDVSCRSGDFLSYFFVYFDPIFLFGFSHFYSFFLTIMVIICVFIYLLICLVSIAF